MIGLKGAKVVPSRVQGRQNSWLEVQLCFKRRVIIRFMLLDYHKSYYARGIHEFSFGRACSVCWFERGDVWTNYCRECLFLHIRGFRRSMEETGKSRRFDRLNFEWKSHGYHLDSKRVHQQYKCSKVTTKDTSRNLASKMCSRKYP